MKFEQIKYEVADGTATITLNRPDSLNAMTVKMMIIPTRVNPAGAERRAPTIGYTDPRSGSTGESQSGHR